MQTNYLGTNNSSVKQIIVAEVPQQNASFTISQTAQDKIIDAVLLQGGGIGFGILIATAGALFIANWLGFKQAISEWTRKQKLESESLKSISDSLSALLKETSNHNDRYRETTQTTVNSLKELDMRVVSLHEDIKEIRIDLKDLSRPKTR